MAAERLPCPDLGAVLIEMGEVVRVVNDEHIVVLREFRRQSRIRCDHLAGSIVPEVELRAGILPDVVVRGAAVLAEEQRLVIGTGDLRAPRDRPVVADSERDQ